ncbi:putative Chloramphenicol 3-O phosphotransferase [Waddlia chondrophila 2032/99]|uniref:Putative Chloramphenicol 3-O phosphotransferase n=2 Tax=Waddlia chondrophila TaxID=71667 RepID=D6YTK4_WADCW|nr:hypothetical protein [Waddlia chondrophila]ADI37465.1 putative Chloramphenicol 3-O phosphotransferase [Waddlia chondrophila WSU 86-1044]CCB90781.1 putative Chloramphenicol 3-O phosphotransferase [Waddlia chondrophila 2032/99]
MKGAIIILDGSPSVGKSTIAKEIQEIAEEPYYYLPIDEFVNKLPSRWIHFTDDLTDIEGIGFHPTTDSEGNAEIKFKAGPLGEKLIRGYINAVKGFSKAGNHVVADAIITDLKWLDWLTKQLSQYPVVFIGLHAPLKVLEQREKERFELQGTARGRYQEVYGMKKPYDLEIDTSLISPKEAAVKILNKSKKS